MRFCAPAPRAQARQSTRQSACAGVDFIIVNNACAGRFIAQVIVFDEREEKNMVAQVSRVTKINYLCRHNTNRNSYKQQNLKIMAYVIGDDCVACGTCIDECPVGAISVLYQPRDVHGVRHMR